jgi:hypothetical protein
MIPTAGTQRIRRTTTTPFEYQGKDGETVTTDIHVEFYARTLPQIREQRRRNLEQSQMLEDREELRRLMVAAEAVAVAARAALDEILASKTAKIKDTLVPQQAVNDAIKAQIDATRAFGEKAKQVALVEPQWLSTGLLDVLAGLPDIEDPLTPGQPFGKPTIEKLEALAINNLEAIEKAIEEGIGPKSQPSK